MSPPATQSRGIIPVAALRERREDGASLPYGFSIVIPAKDEGRIVGDVVQRVIATLAASGEPFEVVVVDDGSSDETAQAAAAAGATVIRHPRNAGYGAALKTGIANVRFDHVIITDADGTYPIDRIPDLMAEATRFDMVVGARQGKYYRESWLKAIGRFYMRLLVTWVTGMRIPDPNSGLRIFTTDLARRYTHVISQGFSFTTTITLAALSNGYFVKYVPIDYHERVGKTRVRLVRDSLRTLQMILQAIAYYNPVKLYLTFAIGCFLLALATWIVFAFTRSAVAGVMAALWTVSIVHFVALGLLADLIRVRSSLREASRSGARVTPDR